MTTAAAILQPAWPATKTPAQLLQDWLDASKALEEAKAKEAKARLLVVAAYPFDPTQQEGTQNLDLANGYKLKVQKKLNYKLADGDSTDKALAELEKAGPEGGFLADRLVKWKPTLSVSEYRELKPEYKKIIDSVLTVTPGMPTLELVEPKTK